MITKLHESLPVAYIFQTLPLSRIAADVHLLRTSATAQNVSAICAEIALDSAVNYRRVTLQLQNRANKFAFNKLNVITSAICRIYSAGGGRKYSDKQI